MSIEEYMAYSNRQDRSFIRYCLIVKASGRICVNEYGNSCGLICTKYRLFIEGLYVSEFENIRCE